MMIVSVDNELELRMLAPEHAPELFALTDRNRAYLREWLPWLDRVRAVGDTETFIEKTINAHNETRAITAGIWRRERLIGVIGHNRIDWDNRFAIIGYWLSEDCQGHGTMTRACRAFVQHAFDALDLNRVEIYTAVSNHRSEAIPRRLGFTVEGIRREGEWLYDRYVDLNMHALLRSTWRLRNAATR